MTESDGRPLCLMVISCIAAGPRHFMPLSDDFHQRYRFAVHANHQADTLPEQMAGLEEEIHASAAFIYHSPDWMPFLGDKRETYEELLARVPKNIIKISVPIPHLYAFWPFHANDPRNNDPYRPPRRDGNLPGYPYGDSYVLDLLAKGLSTEEVISRYVTTDIATVVDLDKLLSLTLSQAERNDRTTDVKVASYIADNFRSWPLFRSVNHANNRLLLYMSNQILEALGCNRVGEGVLERTQELIDELTPIHPSIARYFGVRYADEHTRYPVDRIRYLTFAEYVSDYVYFK